MKKVLTLRKLFMHLVHRPKVKTRARSRTDPTKRRVCAIPGQEGGHCCVHFQRGRARVCSAVRHHRLRQSHTRIQSITSLTRSQGGADGRDGALWRDFTVHVPENGNDGVSPESPHRENRWGLLPNQSIDTGSEQSDDNATTCTSAQHRVSKQTRAKLPMLRTKQDDEHARQNGQQKV